MTRKFIAAGTLATAALTVALFAADGAREQKLQQAIDLMESKGDVAKAIPMFEDAARSSDKALAARALLHLGQAQERLAADKARTTYDRIVKEFPNQTETVAAARQRLSILGSPLSPGGIAKRRVCTACGDSDLSLDGRWMVMRDSEDRGNLAVRNMLTGEVKRLMIKTGLPSGPNIRVMNPTFSPDSRQIVYYMEDLSVSPAALSLRVVPNEPGGQSRVVLNNSGYIDYFPFTWSRDGKSVLLTTKSADRTWQLAWVSVGSGVVTPVKSLGQGSINPLEQVQPALSPDGRYIAYLAPIPQPSENPNASRQHIYVLAADGSSENEVVKTAGTNQNPVWTPDGNHLLYTSDIYGSTDLWSVAIQNGKAAGAPLLVMPEVGAISSMGIHAGSYYYSQQSKSGFEQITIAEMGSGRVGENLVGQWPEWSPDGKSIALKRHVPGKNGDYQLIVHSLDTGDERTFTNNLGISGGASYWLHDGKNILTAVGPAGSQKLQRLDLTTGEFRPIAGEVPNIPICLSPDDKILYYALQEPQNGERHIVGLDLTTGQKNNVFTLPAGGLGTLRISRDGRTLMVLHDDAQTKKRSILRVPLNGGDYREIYSATSSPVLIRNKQQELTNEIWTRVDWTRGDKEVLFARHVGAKWRIMRIPADGGVAEFTGVEAPISLQFFDPSPDGSKLAFSSTTSEPDAGLWALDNVLTLIK